MKEFKGNLFPIFDEILQREDKEELLNQNSKVIWMTGLSGSGKTTVAKGVERYLHSQGILNQLLDGDNIRVGISSNLTFSSEDRAENIRRISEISKLFLNCGIVTINCFVSPTIEIRNIAKEIIGVENFIEVYINASVDTCEKRDVKGLYQKARKGKIIAIVTEGDEKVAKIADHYIEIPDTEDCLTPILATIPLQLISYYIALIRGCNVDQPRNLAKSVTVE